MSCPPYDFHIHTKYLKCANETKEVPAILAECERLGLTAVGFADHVNTPEQAALHASILEDIRSADTKLDVYFGVELNFMACDGEFAMDEEVMRAHGFQYAIGGIHAAYLDEPDLDKLIEIQHRHHLRVCKDPLCDVLVHPYWFSGTDVRSQTWPDFRSVRCIPDSLVRELGQAAKATGTAIEINSMANLADGLCERIGPDYVNHYADYLAALAAEDPMFSFASDAHDIVQLESVQRAWDLAEKIGLPEDRIWKPDTAPVNRPA